VFLRVVGTVVFLAMVATAVIWEKTRPTIAPTHHNTAVVGATLTREIPSLLRLTWQGYKADEIQSDGRVVDHGRAGVSTSEGQSYALLRAAWMDDRPTFVQVWAWTRYNLQVRPDKLFGYLWGRRGDGRWTILDTSSATDADEDIALALVFAGRRWRDDTYLRQARAIAQGIWRDEVVVVRGAPYLTAGSWAPAYATPGPALNPSYLAPYAYRIFAGIDPAHHWMRLVDSSYRVLAACSLSPLGSGGSVGLPPNWCAIRRATGDVAPIKTIKQADVYGYDAFRVMWRVALDYLWNGESRAKAYLDSSAFLRRQWQRKGMLSAYTHTGAVVGLPDVPLFYGADIGDFVVSDPAAAQTITARKLLPLFHQQDGVAYWDQRYSYYEQNWIWFGVAMVGDALPNLAAVA